MAPDRHVLPVYIVDEEEIELRRGIVSRVYHFLCLFLLAACSVQNNRPDDQAISWIRHDNWSHQTNFAHWGTTTRGLGVGFVRPELRDVHPYERRKFASNDEFLVEADGRFHTILLLSTGYDKPYPILLSVVLDYQQVSFNLDGEEGLLHYLEVQPDVHMEIPLEVLVEQAGWHDLFVVAFRLPETHPTDRESRLPPSSFAVGGVRTVLCVTTCYKLEGALPIDTFVGKGTENKANVPGFPLLPDGGRPPNQRLLLSATAEAGSTFPLELWVANGQDRAEELILVPFLNFRQISFGDSPRLHVTMPPQSELFIPGVIELPAVDGVQELQVVKISDPYRPLDKVQSPFVESEMRAAIITIERK